MKPPVMKPPSVVNGVVLDSAIDVELRALGWMLKHNNLITCSNLGELLWGEQRRSGTCPYARPAGALVKRLIERGLAQRTKCPGDPRKRYGATARGERLYTSQPALTWPRP